MADRQVVRKVRPCCCSPQHSTTCVELGDRDPRFAKAGALELVRFCRVDVGVAADVPSADSLPLLFTKDPRRALLEDDVAVVQCTREQQRSSLVYLTGWSECWLSVTYLRSLGRVRWYPSDWRMNRELSALSEVEPSGAGVSDVKPTAPHFRDRTLRGGTQQVRARVCSRK